MAVIGMLSMLFVFLLGFFSFVVFLPSSRPWRRVRSDREEVLHNQIQQAMNWSPDHFYECEDGKWLNARGEEGVHYTLKELMDKYDPGPGKRRKND